MVTKKYKRKTRRSMKKRGGGPSSQPLSFVQPSYKEPSASTGQDILYTSSNIVVRPPIGVKNGGFVKIGGSRKSKGGFVPSIMKGVVDGGVIMAPIAFSSAYRLVNNKSQSRKKRTRRNRK
jgi:hypothetical protein